LRCGNLEKLTTEFWWNMDKPGVCQQSSAETWT
jgi:hypothetical protein